MKYLLVALITLIIMTAFLIVTRFFVQLYYKNTEKRIQLGIALHTDPGKIPKFLIFCSFLFGFTRTGWLIFMVVGLIQLIFMRGM